MGHPSRECFVPGKLHGGVPANGSNMAFKGKGKQNWKGAGKGYSKGNGYKGKGGKQGDKRSLNLASETEYNAAWGNGEVGDNWEHPDYSNYNDGYNYALTNDVQWNNGRNYSFMLNKCCFTFGFIGFYGYLRFSIVFNGVQRISVIFIGFH